jgi:hypothetical protein
VWLCGAHSHKSALYHDLYVNINATNGLCWLITSAVDVDLDEVEESDKIEDGEYQLDANANQRRLRARDKISQVWPEPPHDENLETIIDDHLHVFVRLSGGKKGNITPTDIVLGIEVIDQKINEELDSLRGMVETFLKNPEPRTWNPPDSVTPSEREFLTNPRIPSYRNGNPSLLFHNLDLCRGRLCDDKEIEMIFGPAAHWHQYVIISCALNTSQHVQAGAFATHLTRAKPVACWKASRNTGDSTLLQLQMSPEFASEIYKTLWTMSLSVQNGGPTLKKSMQGNGLINKKSTVRLPLCNSGKS